MTKILRFPCDLARTMRNTLREFLIVIAAVAKVSCKHGLWLVARVNKIALRCFTKAQIYFSIKKVYALLVFPRNHSPYTFLFPFLNFFILKKRNLILRAGFLCNDFPGKPQRNIM